MYQPKPYEVRIIFKYYLRLLANYNVMELTGFNKSGQGSHTYYCKSIENKREFLRKWGHLLTVRAHHFKLNGDMAQEFNDSQDMTEQNPDYEEDIYNNL